MSPTQRPFRFGVVAPQAQSGAEYVALARRAEEVGYSTLLLPDTPGAVLAPFSTLGVVAGATSRLRVGNWVLANDFRHPVQVAREAATLAVLSDGRFDLGIGPGRDDNDYASLGLAELKGSGGVRLKKLAEALKVMRALFSGERVTLHGDYYDVTGASLYPLPKIPPPILIAACYTFVVPENQPERTAGMAAVVRRNFGFDLNAAIADRAPNILQGTPSDMLEQLEERRASFGLSYIVVGSYDAEMLGPVVERATLDRDDIAHETTF